MAGITYRQMMANMIPKWLSDSQFIQAAQVVNASTSTVTTNALSNAYQASLANATYLTAPVNQHINPIYYAGGAGGSTTFQNTAVSVPSWVRTRNRFAELLHAIEDINGLKFPYDDDINDMLDMRNFKRTNCKVRLTAFCCFMNCNGVDRHNHAKMLDAAEDMGVEFVP